MTQFTRDVFVNVLANLIAGFIIYLGGVAIGLFRSTPTILTIAITSLIGLLAGTALGNFAKKWGRGLTMLVTILLTGGVYIALRGLIWPAQGTPTWLGVLFTIVGAGLVSLAGFVLAGYRPEPRIQQSTPDGSQEQG